MATFTLNITPNQNYATSLVSEGIAGQDLIAGSICYLNNDGKYYLASATNIKCKDRELRVAISNIIANETGFLLEQGYIVFINSFILGQVYYLSETPGQVTSTIYNNNSVTRYIGTAESTSKLRFNPNNFDTGIDFLKTTKANLEGSSTQLFSVEVATAPSHAIRKDTFDTAITALQKSLMIQGSYNASTNTPSLSNGTGLAGDVYVVSVAGSRDFGNGFISLLVDDVIWYNGAKWTKLLQRQISDIIGLQDALNSRVGIDSLGDEFYIDQGILYGNVSTYRQTINYTSGSQVFTLDFEPTFFIGIFVNGKYLDEDDYIYTTPDELEILGTLQSGDTIKVIYEHFNQPPTLPK